MIVFGHHADYGNRASLYIGTCGKNLAVTSLSKIIVRYGNINCNEKLRSIRE